MVMTRKNTIGITTCLAAAAYYVGLLLTTRISCTSSFLLVPPPPSSSIGIKNNHYRYHGDDGLLVRNVLANEPNVDTTTTERQKPSQVDDDDNVVKGDDVVDFKHAFVAEKAKPDFEILKRTVTEKQIPLIYMDSGASSQKPNIVLQTLDEYYRKINSNVHRGAHTLSREATTAYEHARDKVAKFINAPSRNEIIFTSGATESLNLIAQSYGRTNLQQGDEIVLTVAEHHANLVPWQMLAEEKDLKIHYVKLNPETGCLDLQHMESILSTKTKIVAFQHVSNVLGCINPVQEMIQMIRSKCGDSKNTKIVLDACQSVPHCRVDVQGTDSVHGIDFLVASGHKMCGPTGIGFLWGHEDVLNNEMPPWMGGGEMIDRVTLEGSTFLPAPSRFEAGTPAIAQAIGLGAAIDYLNGIGMENIEAYEHELAQYLYQKLSQVKGITILGPPNGKDRVALCAFTHETIHPSDLSTFLDMEGVAVRAGHHCCQPLHQELGISHSVRASLYLYNTKEDIDAFTEKLESTIRLFGELVGSASSSGGFEDDEKDDDDDFVPFI